jgi:2-oxoacid:acceptor oxidoreductase delta subunit (pyruvate/2-ketoisovalerate family)
MIKPSLKSYIKPHKLSDYPVATVYEAGHLVTKNAGWRTVRPVIDTDKCSGCFQCYMYCPDGAVFKEGKSVSVDYDFCKGCGICAKICKLNVISMEAEKR